MKQPRRWLLIFTEPIPRPKAFWSNINPILAVAKAAVVKREISAYSDCGEMKEGCQLRLAFETLSEAIRRLAEDGYSGDDGKTETRRWAKAKLLREMRAQLGNDETALSYCGNCDRYVLQTYEKKPPKENTTPWIKQKPKPKSVWVDEDIGVSIRTSGEWAPYKGFQQTKLAYEMNTGLGKLINSRFTVGVFEQLPRIRVNKVGATCNVTGVPAKIFELLVERLNFTFEWKCDWNEFGRKDSNGKWSGMMGALQRGEVDIGANAFWQLKSRKPDVKWSIPYSEESVGVMVQKSTEDHKFLFLLPFTYDVSCNQSCLELSV